MPNDSNRSTTISKASVSYRYFPKENRLRGASNSIIIPPFSPLLPSPLFPRSPCRRSFCLTHVRLTSYVTQHFPRETARCPAGSLNHVDSLRFRVLLLVSRIHLSRKLTGGFLEACQYRATIFRPVASTIFCNIERISLIVSVSFSSS